MSDEQFMMTMFGASGILLSFWLSLKIHQFVVEYRYLKQVNTQMKHLLKAGWTVKKSESYFLTWTAPDGSEWDLREGYERQLEIDKYTRLKLPDPRTVPVCEPGGWR